MEKGFLHTKPIPLRVFSTRQLGWRGSLPSWSHPLSESLYIMVASAVSFDISCSRLSQWARCHHPWNGTRSPLGTREGLVCFAKGRERENGQEEGEKQEVDWDKAWSSYRRKKKLSIFSFFDMEKYVSRSPRKSYPLSEEVDPLKRAERSFLDAWINPKFTLAGFGVLMGLFFYMVVIVGPPPPK